MNFLLNLFLASLFIVSSNCGTKTNNEQKIIKNSFSSEVNYEIFVNNLEVPWSIVFTSPERVLVNERPGRLRQIINGKLDENPVKVFSDVKSGAEEGLMGLALHPKYKDNKFIYLTYAYEKNENIWVKLYRFKDSGSSLDDEKIIFDNIPAARFHAGCRIKFGPDDKLYITTGDAGEKEFAQDLNKLHGKILRLNDDGTIPNDNPFNNSPVWTYGHRNPQGIDWYPGTDILWSTEHGPSGFDGPGGGDEVNVIVKGANYGWPVVSHYDSREGMISPVLVFTPAEAPASGMFYKSGKIERFKNCFLFGCLRGNGIISVKVDPNDKTKVLSFEKIAQDFGRIREISEGYDGAIYFSTSNRDGRGKVREGDDKIYRIH